MAFTQCSVITFSLGRRLPWRNCSSRLTGCRRVLYDVTNIRALIRQSTHKLHLRQRHIDVVRWRDRLKSLTRSNTFLRPFYLSDVLIMESAVFAFIFGLTNAWTQASMHCLSSQHPESDWEVTYSALVNAFTRRVMFRVRVSVRIRIRVRLMVSDSVYVAWCKNRGDTTYSCLCIVLLYHGHQMQRCSIDIDYAAVVAPR